MKTALKVLFIIVLIPVVGALGIGSYIMVKNSIFYDHPQYLPPMVKGNSLDSIGSGDLNPIIDSLRYGYICENDAINLTIRQLRKSAFSHISEGGRTKGWETSVSFGPRGVVAVSSDDLDLIESETIGEKQDYLFEKYSISNTPYRIYKLYWETSLLYMNIEADNRCLSEVGADSELIKIAESLN